MHHIEGCSPASARIRSLCEPGAGVKGRRIRELTSVVQKRFKFPDGSVELYAEKVNNRGLCAIAQAESLRYKLLGGLAVRRWASEPLACLRMCSLNASICRVHISTACPTLMGRLSPSPLHAVAIPMLQPPGIICDRLAAAPCNTMQTAVTTGWDFHACCCYTLGDC
jgi:hypothetical protein